jgi:hypothetical protein
MKREKEESKIKIEQTPLAFPEAKTKQSNILITPSRRKNSNAPTLQV